MPNKLTKRAVDTLLATPASNPFLWCGEVRGFGVRRLPSGTASFLIQYRNKQGQTRRLALGAYGVLTVDQARDLARVELVNVLKGADPSRQRKTDRAMATVTELCDDYFAAATSGQVLHRGRPKKASTLTVDVGRMNRHIKPLVGRRLISELERKHVEAMYNAIASGKTAVDVKTKLRGRAIVTGGTGTAARAVDLLSAIFNYGVRKGVAKFNPCLGVQTAEAASRTRFLIPDEYARLGQALATMTASGLLPTQVRYAIEALALTGFRKNEVLTLQATDVDLAGNCIRLRDSKSGPQMRPCGSVALQRMTRIANPETEWVFPALRGGGCLVGLPKYLARVMASAKLKDVTAHTLRHSFATVAHELNYSELTIAGLLGHRAGSVTANYAHHVDHALASAADAVSSKIAERMGLIDPVTASLDRLAKLDQELALDD